MAPPTKPRRHWQRVAEVIFKEHGLPFHSDLDAMIDREGFLVGIASTPTSCGLSLDNLLVVPFCRDPRLQWLLKQHERSHGWTKRLALGGANEADHWELTGELVWPSEYRTRELVPEVIRDYEQAPLWFLAHLVGWVNE